MQGKIILNNTVGPNTSIGKPAIDDSVEGVMGTVKYYTNGMPDGEGVVAMGQWNLVVITMSDGQASSQLDLGAALPQGEESDSAEYTAARFSNVSLYGDVLSEEEASAIYNRGIDDLTDPNLSHFWSLESGTIAQDAGTGTNVTGIASGTPQLLVDLDRPSAEDPSLGAPYNSASVNLDLSPLSLTDTVYWRESSRVDLFNQMPNVSTSLSEINFVYTVTGAPSPTPPGGGAANLISGDDTLVSNLSFSTVSGNAVVIDSRNKFGVRILAMNSAFDCTLRKDTSGGDIISYVPAGNTRLRATIAIADGTNVYLDGDSNTTLTYTWTHSPIV